MTLARNQSRFFRNRPNPSTALSAVSDSVHVICHRKKVSFPFVINDNACPLNGEFQNVVHAGFSCAGNMGVFFAPVAHEIAQNRTGGSQ